MTEKKEIKEDMTLGAALGSGLGSNPLLNSQRQKKQAMKESAKEPAANSLSKHRVDKLFRMFCFNSLCPRDAVDLNRLKWKDCSGCLLREIPWERKKGQVEDLCYAIWYEGVLNA